MTGKLYLYRDVMTADISRERLRSAVDREVITRLSRGVYTSGDRHPGRVHALFVRLPAGGVLGYE